MAAALGFYALICIGPLALLLAWSLQIVIGPDGDTYEWVSSAVEQFAGEAAGAVLGELDALLMNPDAHIAGIFSLLLLVWAGMRLFEALEMNLDEIWGSEEARGVFGRKLIALAAMIGAGLLVFVFLLLGALLPSAVELASRLLIIDLTEIRLLKPGLRLLIELPTAFAGFFLLYKFMPVRRVSTRSAAVGALFSAALWMAIMPILRATALRSAGQSAIYGGLAGVVMFLTWAFIGAQLLLAGAHLAAAHEHVAVRGQPEGSDDDFIHMEFDPEETRSRLSQ